MAASGLNPTHKVNILDFFNHTSQFCNVYYGNWHAYYEEYNFFNILHSCISEMVILRKQSVRKIFIDNCMINHFCLIYFYYKTYRLAGNFKKTIFAAFDLEYFFSILRIHVDNWQIVYNRVSNIHANFKEGAN